MTGFGFSRTGAPLRAQPAQAPQNAGVPAGPVEGRFEGGRWTKVPVDPNAPHDPRIAQYNRAVDLFDTARIGKEAQAGASLRVARLGARGRMEPMVVEARNRDNAHDIRMEALKTLDRTVDPAVLPQDFAMQVRAELLDNGLARGGRWGQP